MQIQHNPCVPHLSKPGKKKKVFPAGWNVSFQLLSINFEFVINYKVLQNVERNINSVR